MMISETIRMVPLPSDWTAELQHEKHRMMSLSDTIRIVLLPSDWTAELQYEINKLRADDLIRYH